MLTQGWLALEFEVWGPEYDHNDNVIAYAIVARFRYWMEALDYMEYCTRKNCPAVARNIIGLRADKKRNARVSFNEVFNYAKA